MQNDNYEISAELRELLEMEIADIIATANEQGFATQDVLAGLQAAVAASMQALAQESNPAELPAGPHSAPALTDRSKTPGTGALPEATLGDVDPGAG